MQDSKRYTTVSENCLYDTVDDIAYTPHPTTNQWIPLVPNQTTLALEVYASSCLALKSIIIMNNLQITIGRDRCYNGNRLRLDDMEVSRFHGIIYKEPFEVLVEDSNNSTESNYSNINNHNNNNKSNYSNISNNYNNSDAFVSYGHSYWIVDQGSTHGTYLNKQRTNEPKVAGLPQRLFNGDKIKIGQTCFYVHIHKKDITCKGCKEIRLVVDLEKTGRRLNDVKVDTCLANSGYIQALSFKQQRNKLKRAFVGDEEFDWGTQNDDTHNNDKSKQRRTRDKNEVFVNEFKSKPIIPETEIKPSYGKGMKMLEMMGWIGGGLGSNQQGTTHIIDTTVKLNRLGIGATANKEKN